METEPGDLAERLREALEQQRATSEILAAISRAPFELDNTLRTILEQGIALCRADTGRVLQVEGSVLRERVQPTGSYQWVVTPWQAQTVEITRRTLIGKAILEARTQHAPDVRLDPEIRFQGPPLTRLAVPITVAGRVAGVLNFHRLEVAPFSASEIALIETFADQAAIAIENVRLVNETKDALDRQTASGTVLRAIADTREDITPVLRTIVDEARRLCAADSAFFYRRDGEAFTLDAVAGAAEALAAGMPASTLTVGPGIQYETGGLLRLAFEGHRTLHVSDMASEEARVLVHSPRSAEDWATYYSSNQRSRLAVPVLYEGAAIGVIRVHRTEPGGFTPQQIGLVESFAAQAAIAIRNVRLFIETKEALERQTATSELLAAMSESAFDLQPVFDMVLDKSLALCKAEYGWIRQTDAAGGGGIVASRRPAAAEAVSLPVRSLHEISSVTGRAYRERRTIHIDDIAADPTVSDSRGMLQLGARTGLGVPLLRGDEVLGVIILVRIEVRPFEPREIELVESFARQAAIAIENTRLLNEIQDKSHQLELAGRHKSEFLANMSHELRTPLNAIIGFSDVLEQRLFGELNERQADYTHDIATSGRHLLDLVNEILDLSKVEAGRMELDRSEFALAETIRATLAFVRERAAGHRIELDATLPADLGTLVADERKVRQVLLNLLSNAVKFTPDGGRVTVHAVRMDDEIEVSVQDNGIGIAPEDQPRVFEEFRQVGKTSDRSREGTGLGLTLAKRFIELHGGRIWIDSEIGKGTTFTFAIPATRPAPAPV